MSGAPPPEEGLREESPAVEKEARPRRGHGPVPKPMTLPALQAHVARVVRERDFTQDPNEIYILLCEELGELATEFKHLAYYPERFDLGNLGFELADLLLYLLDLANGFSVSLMELWPGHEQANDRRFAHRHGEGAVPARIEPGFTLNRIVDHVETKRSERGFEDTRERLMILLTEEVGEIATELRRHWKGKADPARLGMEIIDAITYICRLARHFGIDLEEAVATKESINAHRTWEY